MKFNWTALGVFVTLFVGIPAWALYLNTAHSQIVSMGNASEWFVPEALSGQALNTFYIGSPDASSTNYFTTVRTHLVLSVKNTGDATAEDVRVNFKYDGQYSFDAGKTLQIFDNQIVIGELRPEEEKIISLWTFVPLENAKDGVYINHKNGSSRVDFGLHSYGVWAKVLKVLVRFWILIPIISVALIVVFLVDYFEKKTQAGFTKKQEG